DRLVQRLRRRSPQEGERPMLAHVVIVHDNLEFRSSAEASFLAHGYPVRSFSTALEALLSLDEPQLVDLLIPRVRFPPGESNGMALALSARLKHRNIKILF